MEFICYPKCTTCLKAKKLLDKNNIKYQYRNIKENNPTVEELRLWHKKSNLPLRKFFNTSGGLYKEMNLKDKLNDMNDEEMYQLLASDGMLVKRPILLKDDVVLVGFKEEDYLKILK